MSAITIIFLIIIIVLLIWDLTILRKIYKSTTNGNNILPDEKYFELKYNINLVKSVSVIGLFVIGFLGVSTVDGLKSNVTSEIETSIKTQDDRIEQITTKIEGLTTTLDTLENYKSELERVIKNYESNLGSINSKVAQVNNSLKYNPRIYIVNDLKYSYERNPKGLRVYFKDLTTVFGDKLPNFTNPPYINTEGYNIEIEIQEVTTTYVDLASGSALGEGIDDEDTYLYSLWIASFE